MDKRVVVIVILALLIGYAIGFFHGVSVTIQKVADIGSRFIDIDYEAVEAAIYQYENHISGCYPNRINLTN